MASKEASISARRGVPLQEDRARPVAACKGQPDRFPSRRDQVQPCRAPQVEVRQAAGAVVQDQLAQAAAITGDMRGSTRVIDTMRPLAWPGLRCRGEDAGFA